MDTLTYLRSPQPRRGRPEPDAAQIELIHLKLAHAQLLRYAQDLKLAYEAERARRVELTQVTLELVSALAVLPTQTSAPATPDPSIGGHKQAA